MVGSHLDVAARGVQESAAESQKSSLFPWDNAGVSSSAGFDFGVGSGTPNISSGIGGRVLHRSRSASGREGSLVRSLAGSPVPFSFQNEGPLLDDFQFRGTTLRTLVIQGSYARISPGGRRFSALVETGCKPEEPRAQVA